PLLTHAHIDHAGLLPRLTHLGYRKPIWATEPTNGLLEYLLPDAAGIQESEAERETRKRSRRAEEPFKPLYIMEDATEALKLRRGGTYGEGIEHWAGVRAGDRTGGDNLGAGSVED